MKRSYLADTAWWLELVAMQLENLLIDSEPETRQELLDVRALKGYYWRRLCLNRLYGLPMPEDEL